MKYERFEDLPVWRDALELAHRIYVITKDPFFAQPGDLCDQLRRASLSVSNNIAEGFERGSTTELIAFLYIARGSAGEVRSMLRFADRFSEAESLKSDISNLLSMSESCSRQIRAWADHLQNTDIQGPRHLNEQTRNRYESKRRYNKFQHKMAETLHESHPDIFPDPNVKE